MKIVFFNGGLANQVFQYIFYRYGQIHRPGEQWILDDSAFFGEKVHNGYELEKVFGLHPALLSRTFDQDVWDYMLQMKKEQNKSIPQILLDNGSDIKMVVENINWNEWNPFNGIVLGTNTGKVEPSITEFDDDIYYHGYWIAAGWYRLIEDVLREDLKFPEIKETSNLEYLKKIKDTVSCSIHIRRGDYVKLGISAQDKLYVDWIGTMLEKHPDLTLFVFSDDIGYCKTHMKELGLDLPRETVFVEGNAGESAFRDLQLMSHCKNMINVNSAFCYLAALLNKNLDTLISPPNRQL